MFFIKQNYTQLGILICLLVMVMLFTYIPAVAHYMQYVPMELYTADCYCDCIRDSRPWFSKFNYLSFTWFCLTPLYFYLNKDGLGRYTRITLFLMYSIIAYLVVNLSIPLRFDLHNLPFDFGYEYNSSMSPTLRSFSKCVNVADNAQLAFSLLFGWLYTLIYLGFVWCCDKTVRKIYTLYKRFKPSSP